MKAMTYDVLLEVDGQEAEHTVNVRNADRLQAEVSARGHGILVAIEDAPMTWTTLFLFHACQRLELFRGSWQEFKTALVDFESSESEEVPPTNEAEFMNSVSP